MNLFLVEEEVPVLVEVEAGVDVEDIPEDTAEGTAVHEVPEADLEVVRVVDQEAVLEADTEDHVAVQALGPDLIQRVDHEVTQKANRSHDQDQKALIKTPM